MSKSYFLETELTLLIPDDAYSLSTTNEPFRDHADDVDIIDSVSSTSGIGLCGGSTRGLPPSATPTQTNPTSGRHRVCNVLLPPLFKL